MLTFDFETEPIRDGCGAPRPIGLAVQRDGSKPRYLTLRGSKAHEKIDAAASLLLDSGWSDPQRHFLAHNAPFDVAVAMAHLGLPAPRAVMQDTMAQAFLLDPFRRRYGLKELAQDVLRIEPEERDVLREWVLAQRVQTPTGLRPIAPSRWGAYIYLAPDKLIAPYAKADVSLTYALHKHQRPQIEKDEKLARAYRTECAMVAVLAELQETGLPVDVEGLTQAHLRWTMEHKRLEGWLRQSLGDPAINLRSAAKVMSALVAQGLLDAPLLTEKGNASLRAEALRDSDVDRGWLAAWSAWTQRGKLLSTYSSVWLEALERNGDGRLRCSWSSTRGADGARAWGARTGRLTSRPNLQNIPKRMESEEALPKELKEVIGPAPQMRSYICPAPGAVLLQRDYSQQELRVLAHYEQRDLHKMYLDNPRVDVHERVRLLIQQRTGLSLKRDVVKMTGFSILYGSGAPGIARRLGVAFEEARDIRAGYLKALPGIKRVQEQLARLDASGQPYHTFGGRRYYVEETTEVIQGAARFGGATTARKRRWEYKALNYLIQGSSADCTKLAMIAYHQHSDRLGRLVCSVHDELWIEVDEKHVESEMALLQKCMESVPFSVSMLTDGRVCKTSIAEAKA